MLVAAAADVETALPAVDIIAEAPANFPVQTDRVLMKR
jgi:hypothetical protein